MVRGVHSRCILGGARSVGSQPLMAAGRYEEDSCTSS